MQIIRSKNTLTQFVEAERLRGCRIGLVPTMGALHAGHLSLVRQACSDCDVVVVSIFVNPTQFNNPTDLATYPRTEEADFQLLEQAGADAVFAPEVSEIYPDGSGCVKHVFDLGEVAEVMEGKYRPGHFHGVAQIVSLLLRLVKPDRAYFGEKDFQQIAVIRRMVATEGIPVEIVPCPIVRDSDGLALSSRNTLLTPEQRAIAPGIYEALSKSVEYSCSHSVRATHDTVVEEIEALPGCRVEYFEIVNDTTLQPISEWDDADGVVGCVTVYCGKVRLIDNVRYRPIK